MLKPRSIYLMFAIEIVILLVLYRSWAWLNSLELGGILFLPIILAAYCYLMTMMFLLPVVGIGWFRQEQSSSWTNRASISFIIVLNAAGAIWLIWQLVVLFFKAPAGDWLQALLKAFSPNPYQ